MITKTHFLFFFMLLFSASIFAQSYTLTGTVTDQDNVSVIGVNVLVVGTTTGTVTDFDGSYSIQVNPGDQVQFSYLGYTTQTVDITGQRTHDVVLAEGTELDEIVVVGYGARKKSDVTGSVSSVKAEELTAFPVLDAAQALQGRAAGVQIQTNNGGEPGAPINIRIRGNTSINASSAPLIVVDGFLGAQFPQPQDIESIEVLKDASAAAIYGSRGSNGVVLVTTKKGRNGQMKIQLNSNYSINTVANRLELLNASQWASYQTAINPSFQSGGAETDWQDELYRSGAINNHQISFSGGSDNINYYASGSYFNQQGVIINSDFERATFLTNIDAQVTDRLKLGANLFVSRGQQNGVPTQSTGETANGGGDDVVALLFRFAPDLPIQDANGVNTINSVGDNVDNPFAVATEAINETVNDRNRTNFYGEFKIAEGLTFKSTFGFNSRNSTVGIFRPSTLVVTAGGTGGTANIDNLRFSGLISENYLTYTQGLGNGQLTLLGGYSYQKMQNERFGAGAQSFTSNSFSFRNLGNGAVQLLPSSSFSEVEIVSQYIRGDYDWNDRLLFTATIRRDGASNFAANNKYAIFPSGAVAWKVHNEDFFNRDGVLSDLKLRASYGVTGNQAISPFQSLASFGSVFTPINGQLVNNVTPNQVANPDLRWESSFQTNLGFDLGLWNNRVNVTFDYYNIDTEDLIIEDSSQPQFLGFLNPASLRNVGEVNNRGVELTIGTRNVVKNNFTWSTDLNISRNRNEFVTLLNGADIFQDASPGYFNLPRTHILREGEAVGVFWGLEYAGVYQGGDFPAGTATFEGGQAGDQLFNDLNDDGVISPNDETIIGDPNPDFTLGLNNNLTFGPVDVNIFFQGAFGGDIFNLTAVQLFNGDSNGTSELLNAWTPTNTDTDIPRAAVRGRDLSTRFVEDGTYLRLKNVAIGYNLPSSTVQGIGLENIRFSVSAQNLLTFTGYSGLDPEVSFFGSGGQSASESNTTQGFDFGNYPTFRSINFSLNVTF